MPRTGRLGPVHGAKASAIPRMLHPSAIIRDKWQNTWHRERVEGLVLVEKDFRVVRRGVAATNVFIMHHEYFPNKGHYATKRIVHIIEEVSEEDLFYL